MAQESKIEVSIGKLKFKNPILLASGPLSNSEEKIMGAAKRGFGGIVTKTVTLEACEGNPLPRWAFQDFCLVASDGLPNPGYNKMAEIIRSVKERGLDIPLIGSVAGTSPEEYAEMAAKLEKAGADAIELNMACPHRGRLVGGPADEPLGEYWSRKPERAASVISMVKSEIRVPLWAKFPSDRPFEVIVAMERAGADAFVPFPGVPGMVIDIETGSPVLGNIEGSGTIIGKAIKPIGIKIVSELCRRVSAPVLGTGGVATSDDLIEYLMVGASAIEMLTQAMMQKFTVEELISGVEAFVTRKNLKNIQEVCGLALRRLPKRE